MKKFTLYVWALLMPAWVFGQGPCNTSNASGCVCENNGQIVCDLLPDITISGWATTNYSGGPTEYSQTGNGADNGRLRLSSSTPNIGYGPLTVGSVSMWTCGTDTFTTYPGAGGCANGDDPKQLIKQKVYHKDGSTMTYSERWAGSMTYHQSHGHMHVDDWAVFTLRIEDPLEPDPRNWPIVGDGAKIGFCLMDFGTCSFYNGHCRDSLGNILTNQDFPNYGLGGGNYNCSPVEQGISSGYTDIYGEHLDGMWINIPPGTCNGDYWIVIEVDPNNNFLEADETNNWTAVPFTLTQQVPMGQYAASITPDGYTDLCSGDALTLTASSGTTYLWSTGDTTQSITVNTAGDYYVSVTSQCGNDVSDTVTVTIAAAQAAPTTVGDSICPGDNATLTAAASGDIYWYDAATGGNQVGSGTNFVTPSLSATTTYYAETEAIVVPPQAGYVGPQDNTIGGGGNFTGSQYLTFDAHEEFTLKSVWVLANGAGNRTVEVRDNQNNLIQSVTVSVPDGPSRITLNMNVPAGTGHILQLSGSSMVDLYRNNAGVSYPYSFSNVVDITGSSAGSAYYYFFYDWEVESVGRVCASPRTPAEATIIPGPSLSINGLATAYLDNDPSVSLTGSPSGGTFSGPGVSGNTFDPSAAGVGTHTITYSYADVNGCTYTHEETVTVTPSVNVLNGLTETAPVLYPNPNEGDFTIRFELLRTANVQVSIFSLTGERVYFNDFGPYSGEFREHFTLNNLSRGMYLVEVNVDGQKFHQKLIHN